MTWNIAGKTSLITGGTSGIGLATARGLARQGCNIILTSRFGTKARDVAQSLGGGSATVKGYELDLASPESVRRFVREGMGELEKLDILINNAGMIAGKRTETQEGFEYTLATNYLGPFLLTHLLMPKLKTAGNSRIINLSSELYRNAKNGIDFSDLNFRRGYSSSKAYANSKLATMLFTLELQDRLAKTATRAFAVHPGVIRTNFGSGDKGSKSMALMMKLLGPMLKSPEFGAQTSLLLASSPEEQLGKSWYWSEGVAKTPDRIALDRSTGKRLWTETERLLGLV